MKAILIKKRTLYCIAMLLAIVCVGSIYVLGTGTRQDAQIANTQPVPAEQLSAGEAPQNTDAAYREGLLRQVTSRGNEEKQAVSFMVLVDENTDTQHLPPMLQIFADHQVEASFFVTGKFAEKNKDLLQGILARRHELGNYSYSSINPGKLNSAENIEAIEKTYDSIKQQTGIKTKLYTPPFGVLEDEAIKAAKHFDMTYILATIDSLDWQATLPEEIIGQVLGKAEAGSIISIHPSQNTVEALPTLLKELQAKGFRMITISQHIQ